MDKNLGMIGKLLVKGGLLNNNDKNLISTLCLNKNFLNRSNGDEVNSINKTYLVKH